MDIAQRIAQFENMCREDPENDMAHFSLGGAYNQAGRFEEAARSYLRCVELNPGMSKAYQLGGAALMACGRTDEAAEILRRGYVEASNRGDLMPRNAMAELLEQLGEEVPAVRAKTADEVARERGEGGFVCARTGRAGTKMSRPPFRGPVGAWIFEHISKETFDAWIAQGTKVINELRLDLSREEDAEVYDRHMREYLGIDDALLAELRG